MHPKMGENGQEVMQNDKEFYPTLRMQICTQRILLQCLWFAVFPRIKFLSDPAIFRYCLEYEF